MMSAWVRHEGVAASERSIFECLGVAPSHTRNSFSVQALRRVGPRRSRPQRVAISRDHLDSRSVKGAYFFTGRGSSTPTRALPACWSIGASASCVPRWRSSARPPIRRDSRSLSPLGGREIPGMAGRPPQAGPRLRTSPRYLRGDARPSPMPRVFVEGASHDQRIVARTSDFVPGDAPSPDITAATDEVITCR